MRRAVFAVLLIAVLVPTMLRAEVRTAAPTTAIENAITTNSSVIESENFSTSAAKSTPAKSTPAKKPIKRTVSANPLVGSDQKSTVDKTLTRLRVTLDSASDWSNVQISGASVAEFRVLSVSPGARVERGRSGFSLKGSGSKSAQVLAIYRVADNARTAVQVGKGARGIARARVYRANDVEVLVADVSNSYSDGTVATRGVDRTAVVGGGLVIPMIDSRRLTLAFYYPWFRQGSFQNGLWWDTPSSTSPYDTSEAGQVSAMVGQARSYGVDGFIFSWGGADVTPGRFDLVLNAATSRGNFVVAPLMELATSVRSDGSVNVGEVRSWALEALKRSGSPAFLKVGGRPVLFMFATWLLSPSDWSSLLSGLRSAGYNPFVVGDDGDAVYGFDGVYSYNPNSREIPNLQRRYIRAAENRRLPAMVDSTKKQQLWAATVSPGINKTYRKPGEQNVRSRDDGARYDGTWEASLASSPEWVLITSWNEWNEATHISPGVKTGYKALSQTSVWARRFELS